MWVVVCFNYTKPAVIPNHTTSFYALLIFPAGRLSLECSEAPMPFSRTAVQHPSDPGWGVLSVSPPLVTGKAGPSLPFLPTVPSFPFGVLSLAQLQSPMGKQSASQSQSQVRPS